MRSRVNALQHLYFTSDSAPGSAFFAPRGARLVGKLTAFMRQQLRRLGFQEVVTPQLFRDTLWQQSGHHAHYKDDMFGVTGLDEPYSLKPMNCPGHCLVYAHAPRSFRDLPLRYADFSPLHRNEASGALSGLTRVRRFHQDDGHIFCREDQVEAEIARNLELVRSVYTVFGLPHACALATRPAQFMGDPALWDRAEAQLRAALGPGCTVHDGDGAFYGPKIDFAVRDARGKQHQAATLQLDFQLPRRFELRYAGHDQMPHTPVMIHRAVFGSLERFVALLIEHYAGKWPFWLNPLQAVVLPVAERHAEYARTVAQRLNPTSSAALPVDMRAPWFDVEVWDQAEPLPRRVRAAVQQCASYVLVVGDAEIASGTVSVRGRDGSVSVDALHAEFREKERAYR